MDYGSLLVGDFTTDQLLGALLDNSQLLSKVLSAVDATARQRDVPLELTL